MGKIDWAERGKNTMSKLIQKRQKQEKEALIEQLKKTPIIQMACKNAGVGRATYYRWRNQDYKFAQKADEALEMSVSLMNDLAESQLISAIRDKNMTAIIFWLKHRHQGYSTKVLLSGSLETSIKLSPEQQKVFKKAVHLVFGENSDVE